MDDAAGQFQCPQCPKSYDKEAFLVNHMKKIHSASSPAEDGAKSEAVVEAVVAAVAAEVVEAAEETVVAASVAVVEAAKETDATPVVEVAEVVVVEKAVTAEEAPSSVSVPVAEPTPEPIPLPQPPSPQPTPQPVVAPVPVPVPVVAPPPPPTRTFEYEPSQKLDDHKEAVSIGNALLTHFAQHNFSMFLLQCCLLANYNSVHANEVFGNMITIASYDTSSLKTYAKFLVSYIEMLIPTKITVRNIESYIICELIVNEMNRLRMVEIGSEVGAQPFGLPGASSTIAMQYVLSNSLKGSKEFEMILADDERVVSALHGEQIDYFAFKVTAAESDVTDSERSFKKLCCTICSLAAKVL